MINANSLLRPLLAVTLLGGTLLLAGCGPDPVTRTTTTEQTTQTAAPPATTTITTTKTLQSKP